MSFCFSGFASEKPSLWIANYNDPDSSELHLLRLDITRAATDTAMSVNDTYRASSPEHEPELTAETTAEQIAELKEAIPRSSAPVIAIDLDDVLSCTNAIVAQCTCILLI